MTNEEQDKYLPMVGWPTTQQTKDWWEASGKGDAEHLAYIKKARSEYEAKHPKV
jgi:hypothetical protein